LRFGEISKKQPMKKIQIVLACLALLFALIPFGRAQTNDDAVSLEADAAGLSLLPSDEVPTSGTFWLVTSPTNGVNGITAPFPCLPPGLSNASIFVMSTGIFLVDNSADDANASAQEILAQADAVSNLIVKVETPTTSPSRTMGVHAMDDSGPPLPGGGGGGSGGGTSDFSSSIPINTNLLYLQITNVSGGLAYLNLCRGRTRFMPFGVQRIY
jgi:hypothetical protein